MKFEATEGTTRALLYKAIELKDAEKNNEEVLSNDEMDAKEQNS